MLKREELEILEVVDDAIPPARSAEDIARILAEHGLPSGRGGFLTWLWILATPVLALPLLAALDAGEWEWVFAIIFVILTSRAIAKMSASACNAHAALLMPELDREWLGPLIDALGYPNGSVREVARLRLITVLPTLEPADYENLSPGRRALLFDHLTPWRALRDPDLACAILKFGAESGDEEAVPGTESLASMHAFTAGERRVRTVARASLVDLERKLSARSIPHSTESHLISHRESRGPEKQLSEEARRWLDEIEAESVKRPGMRFGFLLASLGVIFPYMIYQALSQWQQGRIPLAIAFLIFGVLATQLYRFTLNPQQVRLARKLSGVDNIEAVGSLAEMTAWPEPRIQSMAVAALTRLLPRLRSSDTQLLSLDQRMILYGWLKLEHSRRHADFQIALLQALEQVGDTWALPFVRDLAAGPYTTLRQKRVIDAARECMPYLESCAEQNQHSQILLRAITDESADSALLRPARQTESNPDLLVRVVSDP